MHVGLFDSGVGGLTVLREIQKALPSARFTYLGDTARLPYGNKAPETLRKYSEENVAFLESRQVDVIVIACHSASSVCLDWEQTAKGTPIFNVITPSCQEALKASTNKIIGIMATKATTKSGVYPSYIKNLDEDAQVTAQECPLLVPLVEEHLEEDELTTLILKRYLNPLIAAQVDTILLGCTHYPILKNEIAAICGESIQLIDPAQSVAENLKTKAGELSGDGQIELFLTDLAPHFVEHARRLLGPLKNFKIQSV